MVAQPGRVGCVHRVAARVGVGTLRPPRAGRHGVAAEERAGGRVVVAGAEVLEARRVGLLAGEVELVRLAAGGRCLLAVDVVGVAVDGDDGAPSLLSLVAVALPTGYGKESQPDEQK